MKLVTEQAAFLLDVCKLINFATHTVGFTVTGGELQRPIEMQQIYVKTGRSKTLNSNHIRRLAIDLNFFDNGVPVCSKEELAILGRYWESLNPLNRWGGNFSTIVDVPHFERHVA